jgi:hypothetical protein
VKWFRQTFVSTYIAFVGQTQDPWVVSDKQAVEVMQKIWNATCSYEYKINIHTQVYQKVRDRFGSRTILIYIFQTNQRCSDSWRFVIGSTGLNVLVAFFEADEKYQNSDDERQQFAEHYLKQYRFLYKNSEVCWSG